MPKFSLNTGLGNTLGGATGEVLLISSVDSKTSSKSDSIPVGADILKKSAAELPAGVTDMIQSLSINKLIDRADVVRFMRTMTANPFNLKSA
jgi:hypothetical protein